MTLKEHIDDIRNNLEKRQFTNEAAVSQGIVLRLLNVLAWPTFNTQVVIPEYGVEGTRVDFALCHPLSKPIIFVEVKQVGNIDGAEKQLFQYAFHAGVPIAILTDGQKWRFFHPMGEGDYKERQVCELDLVKWNSAENAKYLNRYLNYESIRTGEAIRAIKEDYRDLSKQKEIERRLPEAWNKLIEEADEFLIEVVAEKVENLCGYKPTNKQVLDFLQNLEHTKLHEITVHSSAIKMDTSEPIDKGYLKEDGSAEWTARGKRRVVNAAIVTEMQRTYQRAGGRGDGAVKYPMAVLVKHGIVENTNYDKDGNWNAVAKIVGHQRKTESHSEGVSSSPIPKSFSTSINQNSKIQSKASSTRLAVTMPDGEIIRHYTAMDTFREVIFKLGPEEVLRVDRERMLISTEPIRKRRTVPYRGYHVTGNHGTPVKRDLLERIAKRLRVQLRVEVID